MISHRVLDDAACRASGGELREAEVGTGELRGPRLSAMRAAHIRNGLGWSRRTATYVGVI